MQVNAVYSSAPFTGPFDMTSQTVDVTAPGFDGVWIPAAYLKFTSASIDGQWSTVSVDLVASLHHEDPGNSNTITIGGTTATGNVITTTLSTIRGVIAIPYTVTGTDTTTTEAAAIAALINANNTLGSLGIQATAASGVITLSWPSVAPGVEVENQSAGFEGTQSTPSFSNYVAVTMASTGSETFAIATGTTGDVIQTLTSAGLSSTTTVTPFRWVKFRVNTLTGTNAHVYGNFYGVG